MLYYLLFWTILGFIFHFYITFGTNLLTGGPAQICCFMPISVFRGKGISNGVKTEIRSGVPPPQASVATKNLSGVRSGTLPEGEPITGGHLHHPGALHDEEGVVLPRG